MPYAGIPSSASTKLAEQASALPVFQRRFTATHGDQSVSHLLPIDRAACQARYSIIDCNLKQKQ